MLYAIAVCLWFGTRPADPPCRIVESNWSPSGLVPTRDACIVIARHDNAIDQAAMARNKNADNFLQERRQFVCMENDSNAWFQGQGWRPVEPQ